MALNIRAKIYKIGEVQTIPSQQGGDPFRKRELILDASRFDPYTGEKSGENFVVVEFANKRVDELDKYVAGDLVDVSFVLQGRKFIDKTTHKERFFTSIIGLGLELVRMKNVEKVEKEVTPTQPVVENLPF